MHQFKLQTWFPAFAVLCAAALVIGCGGGGGGTTTTATATTATATASTATATATTATGTSATGTTATSTATTASTGVTDGGIGGVLMPNTIYYAEGLTALRTIKPDGTGDALLANIPSTIVAAIPNPAVTGQWFFAYGAAGTYGIYRNSTLDISGAVQIVPQTYDAVTSLQASPDGTTLYYVASTSSTASQLFKVATISGTPVALDFAESAHLNMKGDFLVYGRFESSLSRAQIYKRTTANSGTPVRLVNDANDDLFPQWNRTGDRVVFKSIVTAGTSDFYTVASDGTGLLRITNTPNQDKLAASFSPDGSQIAFGSVNVDPNQTGLYKTGTGSVNSATTLIKADSSISEQIYWTGTNGRGGFNAIAMIRSPKRRG